MILMFATHAKAQQTDIAQTPTTQATAEKPIADIFETIGVSTIKSLVFTSREHQEIIIARRSAGKVKTASSTSPEAKDKPLDEERYVHLQGIVYTSKEDWVVWLNGIRISPDALPEEALGMEVFKDYIEIKWYDDYTNQIIPLRLRPMQRFNIDSRIFLPG
jgi:hypothetical protein